MDEELFGYCRKTTWCRDWVSQYENYAAYREYGLGVVIAKGGEPVSGASSYSSYMGGIEIEIDTREDYRRKGLAYICGAKLILECLKRGWYPSWDAQNKWSVGLAEKLGYHLDCEYMAYEVEGFDSYALVAGLQELKEKIIENVNGSAKQIQNIKEVLERSIWEVSTEKYEGMDAALKRLTVYMANISGEQAGKIAETAKILSGNMSDNEELACIVQNLADGLEKSAEKSAESANRKADMRKLSKRQKQILTCMQQGKSYRTEEVAQMIGLKGPRTRQLLNELAAMNLVSCTAATKNRRYVKE